MKTTANESDDAKEGGRKIKTQLKKKKKCCYCKTQVLFKDKESKKKDGRSESKEPVAEKRSDNAAAKLLWQEMTGSK